MVEIESGDVYTDLNFGNYGNGIIAGYKISDPNGDGVLDDGVGLEGWTIYLDANDNGLLDDGETSVQTDSNGLYAFYNVTPGDYIIAEVPQDDWVQTFPEPNVESGRREHRVTLQSNTLLFGAYDFGNAPSIEIHGRKWHDLNADGVQDPDEPGLANWTIYLDTNFNGQLDFNEFGEPIEPTAVTLFDDPATEGVDETGLYWFTDLLPGFYVVNEVVQDGWRQTYPAPPFGYYFVYSDDAAIENIDFGNVLTASISGTKWFDVDGDGVRQLYDNIPDMPQGDVGLADWLIYLDLNGNGVWDGDGVEPYTYTAADDPDTDVDEAGSYSFDNLLPGDYIVREMLQPNWVQSLPGHGVDDSYEVTLAPGENRTGLDFANVEDPMIHGRKWLDFDGDGRQGPNEPGLYGWTIYLDLNFNGKLDLNEETGAPLEPFTMTGEDGSYWFSDLLPGVYVVAEVKGAIPWQQTYPNIANQGQHVLVLDSGEVAEAIDFGNRIFGDCNNDRRVDNLDLDAFVDAFHSEIGDPNFGQPGFGVYNACFDYEPDGDVDFADMYKFREALVAVMPPGPLTAPDGGFDSTLDDLAVAVLTAGVGSTTDVGSAPVAAELISVPCETDICIMPTGGEGQGEIHGTKWLDNDGDGRWEEGEPPALRRADLSRSEQQWRPRHHQSRRRDRDRAVRHHRRERPVRFLRIAVQRLRRAGRGSRDDRPDLHDGPSARFDPQSAFDLRVCARYRAGRYVHHRRGRSPDFRSYLFARG